VTQYHFTPNRYLESIREEVPAYDELQSQVARASKGIAARRILDLGVGTGETAASVLDVYPAARLVGIDASEDMLGRARELLPGTRIESLVCSRLERPLPAGSFDLVVSALAVHHLDGSGKADLFRRVAEVLRPGGRFVLGDVVIPERPEDAQTPLTPDFDLPDRVDDQLAWLSAAGFEARVAWADRDLAVLVADSR
jgi:tRNA (cmo5U34)-methyltransferase